MNENGVINRWVVDPEWRVSKRHCIEQVDQDQFFLFIILELNIQLRPKEMNSMSNSYAMT